MLLTIGQLASYCGVTVRAVRHYHRIGLLPEPARDASGYRRYGADTVVDLIRIKVLADGGVPLARISELLTAGAGEFAATLDGIDQALELQIRQLEHRRRQLAGLLAGDRLALPAEVAEMLGELRALGVSERGVRVERDGWILLEAFCPELVLEWTRQKRAALEDDEFRRIYLACDAAWDWDSSDPRLDDLADWMADWAANRRAAVVGTERRPEDAYAQSAGGRAGRADPGLPDIEAVAELMATQIAAASPAWRRLDEMSRSRLSAETVPHSRSTANSTGRAGSKPTRS